MNINPGEITCCKPKLGGSLASEAAFPEPEGTWAFHLCVCLYRFLFFP